MISTGMITALAVQVPGFTPGPGWNLVADVQDMLSFTFMRNAFAAGTASAVVAGLIGYFVVLRQSSFAAHAISHIGFAGAAGAVLLGFSPVLGVAVLSLAASGAMGVLGQRLRGRDVVIGLVMAASLGLGYLFISLYTGNAQNAYSILFGQIFGITTGAVLITIGTSVIVLAVLTAIFRPLLFASLDEEVAQARGVRAGAIGIGFMLLMALAVSEAVQVSGVLLIFALLVAPGAIAERIARRPAAALAISGGLAVLITWISLALSYYTPYPVSFYVTTLAFVGYLASRAWTAWAGHAGRTGRVRGAGIATPTPRWAPRRLLRCACEHVGQARLGPGHAGARDPAGPGAGLGPQQPARLPERAADPCRAAPPGGTDRPGHRLPAPAGAQRGRPGGHHPGGQRGDPVPAVPQRGPPPSPDLPRLRRQRGGRGAGRGAVGRQGRRRGRLHRRRSHRGAVRPVPALRHVLTISRVMSEDARHRATEPHARHADHGSGPTTP